jgi:2-hydroxycyclohexanecarboxyl-CoA dehydrogenase
MTERVAAVTGGGRGIGRAIVEALVEQGRRVAVLDLDPGEPTPQTTPYVCDITDSGVVTETFLAVADELGPVEILVNCAGWDELRPFLDTDEAFWDRVIEINFKGMLRTCRAVLPGMIEQRWGRIVNIGSDAGRVGSSLEAVYSGAKGGVIAFTKTLARETARQGITVNAVCPGPTDTPLLGQITGATDDAEQVIAAMTRAVPMKRLAEPHEIAGAVAYFCSDEATFTTGQTLSVSGGLTMS